MRYIIMLIILISFDSCQRNNKIYKVVDTDNFSNFQISYDYSEKYDYYTSADSTFTRLYSFGKKKIKVVLTKDDKRKIFEVLKKADFLSLPDTIIENKKGKVAFCHSTMIIVLFGQKKKKVFYKECHEILDKDIEKRYNMIKQIIEELIYNKVEVKNMAEHDMKFL